MDLISIVESMSLEMYERLKHAAETGKWPDGTPVEQAQRDSALQLSMAYQSQHLENTDNMTIGKDGQIITKSKSELRNQFKQATPEENPHEIQNKNNIARFTNL